ncbi:17351_t:CDS:2 [Gigaspora margarita]|uniref:17351_t:CDS:1 n=1 Tax=Gigaspora margarita TaxID=4874 RepID=A0ABN7UPQ8_GIGMA|nr:17351_t:CDS:2 [Gigaspora margarita]
MNPSEDLIQKCLVEGQVKFYEYTRFKDIELIGEGGYGKVYRATFKDNEITVALKSFKGNHVSIKEIVNELKLHCRVDMHSKIIRLHGATKNEDKQNLSFTHYMFVLEYADSGTLRSYLRNNFKYLSWYDKINFSLQITSAIKCLHVEGIIHRDLDDIEPYQFASLIIDIKNGLRENHIEGTPPAYIKIYTDCWQHNPDSRPDIQQVFLRLKYLSDNNDLDINKINQCFNTLKVHEPIQSVNHSNSSLFISDSTQKILMQDSSSSLLTLLNYDSNLKLNEA